MYIYKKLGYLLTTYDKKIELTPDGSIIGDPIIEREEQTKRELEKIEIIKREFAEKELKKAEAKIIPVPEGLLYCYCLFANSGHSIISAINSQKTTVILDGVYNHNNVSLSQSSFIDKVVNKSYVYVEEVSRIKANEIVAKVYLDKEKQNCLNDIIINSINIISNEETPSSEDSSNPNKYSHYNDNPNPNNYFQKKRLSKKNQTNGISGEVINFGSANYLNKENSSKSFFITVRNEFGDDTQWGLGIKLAVEKESVQKGQFIELRKAEATIDSKTKKRRINWNIYNHGFKNEKTSSYVHENHVEENDNFYHDNNHDFQQDALDINNQNLDNNHEDLGLMQENLNNQTSTPTNESKVDDKLTTVNSTTHKNETPDTATRKSASTSFTPRNLAKGNRFISQSDTASPESSKSNEEASSVDDSSEYNITNQESVPIIRNPNFIKKSI